MLHLNARVHFNKVNRAIFVHQKFHRACAGVAHLFQRSDHARAQFRRASLHHTAGDGELFNQFLVAALNAAFALAEMHDVPVLVPQHF